MKEKSPEMLRAVEKRNDAAVLIAEFICGYYAEGKEEATPRRLRPYIYSYVEANKAWKQLRYGQEAAAISEEEKQ